MGDKENHNRIRNRRFRQNDHVSLPNIEFEQGNPEYSGFRVSFPEKTITLVDERGVAGDQIEQLIGRCYV